MLGFASYSYTDVLKGEPSTSQQLHVRLEYGNLWSDSSRVHRLCNLFAFDPSTGERMLVIVILISISCTAFLVMLRKHLLHLPPTTTHAVRTRASRWRFSNLLQQQKHFPSCDKLFLGTTKAIRQTRSSQESEHVSFVYQKHMKVINYYFLRSRTQSRLTRYLIFIVG